MTRDWLKNNLATLIAYSEGKTIQYKGETSRTWEDTTIPSWVEFGEYRVKPEETFVFILYAGNTRWLSLYDVTETKANSVLAQERSVFPDKSFRMDKFKKVEGEQAK